MTEEKRVIVTGHRDWDDFEAIVLALEELEMNSIGPVCIVHGGADGADSAFAELAIANCQHLGWTVDVHRPDYTRYPPKVAPLVRNTEMVKKGADQCIAFYDGRRGGGTVDTMNKAERAGIAVVVVRPRRTNGCPACDADIVTGHMNHGDIAQCWSCGQRVQLRGPGPHLASVS